MEAKEQQKLTEILATIKAATYQKEGVWRRYSYRQMASVFQIPYNDVKLFVSQLRSNPNIDYEYVPTEARYRPVQYRYLDFTENTITLEKFQQLSRKEFEYVLNCIRAKLQNTDVEKDYTTTMMAMIVVEEMKREGFCQDWQTAKIGAICRYTGMNDREVEDILDLLCETRILKSLGASRNYMLALSEDAWQKLEDFAYSEQFDAVLKTSQESLHRQDKEKTFQVLSELNEFEDNVDEFIAFNSRIGVQLLRQKKILTALQEKEAVYSNTLVRIDAVSRNYTETQEENARLKEENKKLRNENKISDKFYKTRQNQIEARLDTMSASLVSVLEKYFSKPVHEKNQLAVINHTKTEAIRIIFAAIDDIKSGKESV